MKYGMRRVYDLNHNDAIRGACEKNLYAFYKIFLIF